MSRHVVISRKYVLRVYASSAILFCRSNRQNDRILSRIEKDILSCVDGKKDMKGLLDYMCNLYSIQERDETASEYQMLKQYLEQYIKDGILEYEV